MGEVPCACSTRNPLSPQARLSLVEHAPGSVAARKSKSGEPGHNHMAGFGRLMRTLARISRTRYPGFVFGLPLSRREIPVFIYHDVETPAFARDLEFLNRNK